MAKPHYKQNSYSSLPRDNAHFGLLFNRFFDGYEGEHWQIPDVTHTQGNKSTKLSGKLNFLQTLLQGYAKHSGKPEVGDAKCLNAYHERQAKLLQSLSGISLAYRSEWNWISGLGYDHPVENGILIHHTLSVPYLTGSTVKGVVRAWLESRPDKIDEFDKKIELWFGSNDKAGELVFFDALPISPVGLMIDVMTPHIGNWLDKASSKTAPGDWIDPVPIPFLCCTSSTLNYSVAPVAGSSIDMVEVESALTDALDFLGVGAKTSNGYGLFVPST